MIWHPRDLHLRTGHIEIGGYDEQSVTPGWQNLFSNRSFTKQRLGQTDVLDSLQTKRAGGICLWIEIDKQNPLARLGQRGAEIDGRGCFANPAFLISDRDDFHSGERTRLACWFRRPRRSIRITTLYASRRKSSRWRGHHRQHASRVRSPELAIASRLIITRSFE